MADSTPGVSWPRLLARGLLAGAGLAAFILALVWLQRSGLMVRALQWIESLGHWGPVMFIVLYVAAMILLVPASLFTFGAGFVFGMAWGSVHVLVAATLAANVVFLIGRHVARDWIARKIASHPKFMAIDEAVAREGWKIAALVRLAPIFPFAITSYAFGLTRIPFWNYFFANFMMVPGTLMYIYFGAVARDLTEKVATPPWIKWTTGAVTVLVILYVTQFARRALARKIS